MTCGLVAGDEDCYTTFSDLFDIVVGSKIYILKNTLLYLMNFN